MTEKQKQRYEHGLFNIGLEAAIKHPKAKLWAGANNVDNFSLAIFGTIHNAVLDDVILLLDNDDSEWLNEACKNNEKKLKEFVSKIAAEAYGKLK